MSGSAHVSSDAGEQVVPEDEAVHTTGRATVTAGPEGATLWRWEVFVSQAPDDGLVKATGVSCDQKLSVETALPEAAGYLIRCERADFPLGSETPKHTHLGPGIRSLLCGEVDAEIGDERAVYRKGEAWFERGPDPVIGRSSPTLRTAFVRFMVLPAHLQGRSSFQYWDEKAKQIPRSQNFKQFVDKPIVL